MHKEHQPAQIYDVLYTHNMNLIWGANLFFNMSGMQIIREQSTQKSQRNNLNLPCNNKKIKHFEVN